MRMFNFRILIFRWRRGRHALRKVYSVQLADLDDGDHKGYESVGSGDDRAPGVEEVMKGAEGFGEGKVLVRIEMETFEVGGVAGYDGTGSL